ncbi:MAG: hypothetical protein HKL89_07750 [Candidatus Dormibacteraeota bacterium]|nr:hypothetical protein [Candidatus Dormibacteraeota bacterium]
MRGFLFLTAGLLLVGCASKALPIAISSSAPTVNWTANAVSFAQPEGWSRAAWSSPSSFTFMVAAVSNQQLKEPCFKSGNTSGCGQPLAVLQPGALLVEWWENGLPTWSFARQAGSPMTVDGLHAKIQDGTGGTTTCSGLGADRWISVVIERPPTTDNYFQFVACMRGPGLAAERNAAMTILQSAHFFSG